MPTTPYLHFDGQCVQAMAFYIDVFGGTDLRSMRYADMPDAPEAFRGSDRVMHSELTLGDDRLMASDYPPGSDAPPQQSVSVAQHAPDAATAHRWFDRLADGGTVVQPMVASFFSPAFGMVRDRFGTQWIVMAAGDPPAA